MRKNLPLVLVLSGACAAAVIACGSPPQPAPSPPPAPAAPIAVEREKPVDITPVPDPPGLVVVGRISKPDAIVNAVGTWTKLPLPSGADLVRSIADDSVAEVVDLSQPIDAALSVGLSRRGVDPLVAFAVSVKSFDQAKVRLGQQHRLVQTGNGGFRVEGIGKHSPPPSRMPGGDQGRNGHDDNGDEDDGAEGCVLAHAPQGARLVCGESAALEALTPYLSRTMPRQQWPNSDVHIEVRPEPVRGPLSELRGQLPILARSFMGSQSQSVREFIDASVGELIDLVNDAQKLQIDAQISDSGVVAKTRFDFQSNKSMIARLMTQADRADATPAAFWHLPSDTDTAFFGRGSDPKLWDHPRELVTNLLVEATDSAGMPEAERKAIKDLIADRMLTLFTNGSFVYAKGFDQSALEKLITHRKSLKWEDHAGQDEAKRQVVEQVVGWHLFQVSEPIAKVGPMLKDWSALWNRPTFSKWITDKTGGGPQSSSLLPRMRIAPTPAGVTLPNGTVHLEITIPREDLVEASAPVATPPPPPPPNIKKPNPSTIPSRLVPPILLAPPPLHAQGKKIPRKPVVFHAFAVPDGGSTWLAFGLDAKLVAQKAAVSLASAPDKDTLGKATAGQSNEALREGKLNAGGILTLRGLAVIAALDSHGDRSPFMLLGSLPNKGTSPVVITGKAEPSSATSRGGAGTGTLRISRAVIEDAVKLVMTAR